MTSSMPTSAATARAVVALSPVSSTGRRPSAFSDATASAELGLTVSATTNTAAAWPSQPAAMAVCPRASAAPAGGVELGGQVHRPVGQQRRAADDERVPVDDALDAEALAVGEALDRGQRRRARPARPWRWPGAMGCSEAFSSAPTSRSASAAVDAVGDGDLDEGHLAGGDRAGLVEHDGVDRARGLQDLGALDEQPELGAAAGADHQRGRGGQSERARAGDDEHGDGGGERERGALAGAEPEAERGDGERDDDGHEDARDAVGEPLDRRLAGLGVLDQAGDLRERGVGADLGGADDEPAAGVDGRAGDLRARLTSTGTDSPVSMLMSTAEVPSSTMPSVATFSPGRTTKRSPTRELVDGHAALGCRRRRGWRRPWRRAPAAPSSAAPARRLARASK